MLAYIDPGAGTILVQMIVGSLVGIVIFFRQTVARLLGLGRRCGSGCQADADKASQS
jgi:hypothetical protein